MKPFPNFRIHVIGFLLSCTMAGCGESPPQEWAGRVDTLPGGTIRVTSPAMGLWAEGEEWTIVEELRIGSLGGSDAAGTDVFGSISGVVVDDLDRIFVLDRQSSDIRVFDRNGAYVQTIGREGAGPGEFDTPTGLTHDAEGSIWVIDAGNSRYQIFDTAGSYRDFRVRRIAGISSWRGGFDDQGRMTEVAPVFVDGGLRSGLIRFDAAFEPRDTLLLPEVETATVDVRTDQMFLSYDIPFTGRAYEWVDPGRGRLWLGVTDRYEIAEFDSAMDTVRILGREYDPIPLPDSIRDASIDRLVERLDGQGDFNPSDVPGVYPVFSRFFPGPDGTFWVRLTQPDGRTEWEFDVFGSDGRFLGTVTSPISFTPAPLFKGDHMYGVTTDDLGVSYVVRARIERGTIPR